MIKSLQLVAFDNPNPPDYGGAVDLYYKLEAFHALGVKIKLHLFTYGDRNAYEPLYDFCDEVIFYKRSMAATALFSRRPFIVKSREHPDLLKNLAKHVSPILFEGIHCCAFLHREALKNHFKMVRMHNIEHEYYEGLSKSSSNLLKKGYYQSEANKLKRFEPQLAHADLILAITQKDAEHFQQYGKTQWIPPFGKPFTQTEKTENYVLFHGNLSVAENYKAANLLVEKVFDNVNAKVIVAGKSPHPSLVSAMNKRNNVALISNPNQPEMEELITKAKCHVFYTHQNTGIKLKLVHAIQTAGHIVMNDAMLFDSAFADEVELANSWQDFSDIINRCMESDRPKPRDGMRALFDNKINALQILMAQRGE